jgi:hypothetical protein
MTALYIVGGILLLLALLLSSPVSLRFYYKETPLCVLRVWGVPIRLLPRKEKPQKEAKAAVKADKKPSAWLTRLQESFQQDGVAATLKYLGEAAKLLATTTGKLLCGIKIRLLRIELRVGGEDAAAAAIHFGEVCAVLYPLLSAIGCQIQIKKRAVEVRPDFEGEGTAALVDIRCGISLWRVCGTLLASVIQFVRIQLKQTDNS